MCVFTNFVFKFDIGICVPKGALAKLPSLIKKLKIICQFLRNDQCVHNKCSLNMTVYLYLAHLYFITSCSLVLLNNVLVYAFI